MARRVYFAFHYQDVIDFRANVVRKHNFTQGVESAGYYDYSIWEESKRKGDLAMKRMINAELESTSVTVVLVGTFTYARRWVRYEIIKSMQRGNKLLGIHINGIRDKDGQVKVYGNNPFDYLSVEYNQDGTSLSVLEWDNGTWKNYRDVEPYTLKKQRSREEWGNMYQLNKWYELKDWVGDDGFNNFDSWIE
jgi:hypothetical protein